MTPTSQVRKVSDRAKEQGRKPKALIGPDPTDFKRFSVDRTQWQE